MGAAVNAHETIQLDDTAEVVITGKDLKDLHYRASMLGSGMAPKGEMCFVWAKALHAVVENAELLKE